MKSRSGFTMIELMIVVAIVAFLSMISIPSFLRFLAKAKRAEVYMNLGSLYLAQESYKAEHGTYSTVLAGPGGIGWKPQGYAGGGRDEKNYYTYGFSSGQEGINFFTGNLETPAADLKGTHADKDSFVIAAAGDIDGDGVADVITIDHNKKITIVQDDLVD